MPHKKNPDVFEIIRGRCNTLQSIANEITLLTTNLPSGYHRDLQLLKEKLFPAFQSLRDCIRMTGVMLSRISIKDNILADDQYKFLFSVEEVNKLVLQGVPFRDAYKKVGVDVEQGRYSPSRVIQHTHEGSIGNLCNPEIRQLMQQQVDGFGFDRAEVAIQKLIQ